MRNKRLLYLAERQPRILHLLVTMVGGYLGAYALLLRGGNFGNAQTGNLLEMMLDVAEASWGDLLLRLGAMGVFILALVLSTLLKNHTRCPMVPLTLGVEGIGVLLAACIPAEADPLTALYPIFFLTAFQWGTFSGAEGYSCATIFSTNNLRQAVTGWTEWLATGNQEEGRRARFYTATLCAFLLGGLAGGLLCSRFSIPAVLFAWVPLGAAGAVYALPKGEFVKNA